MNQRFDILAMSTLLVITMATSAFAQAQESITFQVSSGATQGRMNGHTEMAGGITLARTSGELSQDDADDDADGTVVIDYGVPITNAFNTDSDGDDTIDNNIVATICGEAGTATDTVVDGNILTLTIADNVNCGATGDHLFNKRWRRPALTSGIGPQQCRGHRDHHRESPAPGRRQHGHRHELRRGRVEPTTASMLPRD